MQPTTDDHADPSADPMTDPTTDPVGQPRTEERSWGALVAAWSVHLYTATGVVLALLMMIAVWEGDIERALWLMLVAMLVDGTDGMLARRFVVKKRVPSFDGALLDNIVDYLTYVFAPVVLLWSGDYLGDDPMATALAVLPLMASAYQFCRVDAKTADHLFLGFPSYWNVVAFYVVVFDLAPGTVALLLAVCAALVFVPIGYVYPSRTERLRLLTLGLTALWLLSYAMLLRDLDSPDPLWLAVSFGYVVYYVALSLHLTARRTRRARVATA